mgnify:CR=1 FL=1
MNSFFKIIIIFFLININISTNTFATEVIGKIKKEGKNIFKSLTRKSLKKKEILKFIDKNVIIIDDKRGDGIVTYYFEDTIYKRYKNLEVISEDRWKISRLGKLQIFNNDKKNSWKIQTMMVAGFIENTISIKKKISSVGELFEFKYENKTDYYLKLEEKKLNENN